MEITPPTIRDIDRNKVYFNNIKEDVKPTKYIRMNYAQEKYADKLSRELYKKAFREIDKGKAVPMTIIKYLPKI